MKVKVLKYSADWSDKVVRPYLEISKYDEKSSNIFYHKTSDDRYCMILKIDEIYININILRELPTNKEEIIEWCETLANGTYLEIIENEFKNRKYVRMLDLALLSDLGKDIEKYLKQNKELQLECEEKERKKFEKEKLEEQEQKEKEERIHQEKLNKVEKAFKEGKDIDAELFLDLCKKHGVKVHMRTIGSIRSGNIDYISISGCCMSRRCNSTKIFKYVEELRKVLENHK